MAVHRGGHCSCASVRIFEVEEGRSAVHHLEDLSASCRGSQHRSRLAGILGIERERKENRAREYYASSNENGDC